MLANPDVIYPEGDGYGFASGAVALMFEAAMELRYPGRADLVFTRLGKPHPAMFEEAFRRSGTRDAVMIGDTPGTDIRGSQSRGDSVGADGNWGRDCRCLHDSGD